jgi:hypothetical protein
MAISFLQDAQIIPLVATTIQQYSLWCRVQPSCAMLIWGGIGRYEKMVTINISYYKYLYLSNIYYKTEIF